MSSVSKKEKDLYKSLDKLYNKNKEVIIAWLDELKTVGLKSDKIPGLLNNSKLQIITESEDGVYNLILKWIKENKDKFEGYDFTGIPNSKYISLSNDSSLNPSILIKTFKSAEDVERWIINPEVNPINGTSLPAMSYEYFDIYFKALSIMRKIISFREIYYKFPKVHLLFGELDFIYFRCCKYFLDDDECDRLYTDIIKNPKELFLCELLSENIEDTEEKTNVLETEIEILRNRFTNKITDVKNYYGATNFQIIKSYFDKYNKGLVQLFLEKDYMKYYKYEDIVGEMIMNINLIFSKNNKLKGITHFINFSLNNKMNNGETIMDFLKRNKSTQLNTGHKDWNITECINIIEFNKSLIDDIEKCFNPNSNIIENYEDKKLLPMKDPLEDFFEDFEKKLIEIKNPIYSQLIDLTTFKPKENLKYLNNAQYKEFKKERDRYDSEWKKYQASQTLYETKKRGSSPKPPEKPKITLPWGKIHTIAKEIDPVHIKDDVIEKFRKEYEKVEPIIEEYNIIKNMSYKELKTRMGHSPTSVEVRLMDDNELLSMTKEDITNNILYDYSGLADKCSETIDILTNEELDDENYPLAKLQLMVRLKVYIAGTTKYRTECIYAPKLYNYLIKCINNKEDFVNPVTKSKYSENHIEELMKVIRIIDPNIERPVFVKHRNDTLLKINFDIRECDARNYDFHSSFGNDIIRFYNIYLSRVIGGVEYKIYHICTIPADIEISGDFATGSSDITSNTMLFRIFKLFNEGKLLHNYVPPYNITNPNGRFIYIKPQIHFNRYNNINDWIFEDNRSERTKEGFIDMFKHYAQEINNYTL
jgi:hypothetical protein